MNKKKEPFIKKLPSWLRHGVFQGLTAALVAGAAIYVYAAGVNWPTEPSTPTGLEPVFVGVSAAKYDAALADGYVSATAKCNTAFAGSHVCNTDEIIHSYNISTSANPSLATTQAGAAWINNGPPGYNQALVNDCGGWKSVDSGGFGPVWDFDSDRGLIQTCNINILPFACCK